MADIFPYVLLATVVIGAAAVIVSGTVSSMRNGRRRSRPGKRGPAEDPGADSRNPYAPRAQPDPRGWTWLQGPP